MSSVDIVSGLFPGTRELFNAIVTAGGNLYCRLDTARFNAVFNSADRCNFTALDEGLPVGFASASLPEGCGKPAYLTFVGVLPEYRRRGIASELLDRIEDTLFLVYGACGVETVFRNPAHLPWIIPGTADGHPCAPGVDSSSDACRLLKSRGFAEWTAQISYYLNLNDYSEPDRLALSRRKLADDGIEVTLYDNKKHHGLPELFDAIRNPGWKAAVLSHLDLPVIVAVDNNRGGLVIGYTGPLSQSREGAGLRGNFCGIGTHPDYRGRGIARLVFCEMCRRHTEAGAAFMSLYTGETNPARRVYEVAGCRPVMRWSNLRLVF